MTTLTAVPSAQQEKRPRTPPETGFVDLFRVAGRVTTAVLTGRKSRIGLILNTWLQELLERHAARAVVVKVGPKRILVVADPDLSRAVLEPAPDADGFVAGPLKADAMSYLAPRALTLAQDAEWRALRKFNEEVLSTGCPHTHARTFLSIVRQAFAGPVFSSEQIRDAMSRVMLHVVLGNRADPRVARDVQELFELVQNPLRRRFAGGGGRALRERFYVDLRRALQATPANDPSLAAAARQFGELLEPETLLQQVPHWMFTFPGAGTNLLVRTLALICARPHVQQRALQEVRDAGPLDDPRSIQKLAYLEACLREAGRLFPPVTKTFHRAPKGSTAAGYTIAADVEVLHYLPLLYQPDKTTAGARQFRPERWLDGAQESRPYPDMFLSGARACPGQDLILFVCKSAAATLLSRGIVGHSRSLAHDPLPHSFPEKEIRFMTPITTEKAAIRDPRELLALNQQQLDELFAASKPGPIPTGKGNGIAMIGNGTALGTVARKLIGWVVWKGKLFRPQTKDLKNRLTPFGIPGIRAKVYIDKSWKSPGDAIILDYSKTSIVAGFIRDEIREVGPGVYLGKVFMGKKHVFDFSVTFK